MNDSQAGLTAHSGDISCLLLPMLECTLLVPNVTVAEMSPMSPFEDIPNSPDWVLGMYSWRNTKLPVVSYEMLNGEQSARLNSRGRVAVLNHTGESTKLPFIGIATQGIPRMAKIGPNDIDANPTKDTQACDAMAVKVGVEEFIIPDVSYIERKFIALDLL